MNTGTDIIKDSISQKIAKSGKDARRPEWLRVKVKDSEAYREINALMEGLDLNTVCADARCPNIWECWGEHRTATFMLLGDTCTRACRYCAVKSGVPDAPDPHEPENVAKAVDHLKLNHVVMTSVERDDLPDFGADHFARAILAVRSHRPEAKIEVLIPEFGADRQALRWVLDTRPDVLNHNTETVPRLFPSLRAKGSYIRSLDLLNEVDKYRKETGAQMVTKSGLMVGLGERFGEVVTVMEELRSMNCDVMTIGQYLNPTKKHAPVARFYTPEEFDDLREIGLSLGFSHVESGPLVRSSYHAHEHIK
ncbi:lipoyl synthase [Myxococcota bacterium]|nr:lipoyl synthase [Myxococcota bacterium]